MRTHSTKKQTKKYSKWAVQDIAAYVLGKDRATYWCMRGYKPGAAGKTTIKKSGDNAYYSGLSTCNSVWACPICSVKIATRRRDEVRQALENSGYYPILVTYTIQHSRTDKLADLLGVLKDGLRYTLNGRFRKEFYEEHHIAGYVRTVEVRWNSKTGWHPHVHEVLFSRVKSIDEDGIGDFLLSRYGNYLQGKGYHVNEHTIDVRSNQGAEDSEVTDYLTKSALELELTGGNLKQSPSLSPFQLLTTFKETGEKLYADLFREYVEVTAGKKWLTWSRGLKAELLPEEEEKEGDEAEDEAETVLTLSFEEWCRVCTKGLRGHLLLAISFGLDADEWLSDYGIRVIDDG